MPPYLAGRDQAKDEFAKVLGQTPILQNLIVTGLRGVGKTVLLDVFKPMAIQSEWAWIGGDFSESSSITEERLAVRLLTDLAVVTSGIVISTENRLGLPGGSAEVQRTLDYGELLRVWNTTPGLSADKLKAVLEFAWKYLEPHHKRGAIFAYDEAQNLADHAPDGEYPLSLLLDVFQSIQRKGIPFMLLLTGLPTLFPKLVEARTFAERMFHIITLDRLNEKESRQAISEPIAMAECPVKFTARSVKEIYSTTLGYPYFIQYVCREVFDVWSQNVQSGEKFQKVSLDAIMRKLDADFFAGRWARATDRQRDLLWVIAALENCNKEFTVQDIVSKSAEILPKHFSPSHVNQLLVSLSAAGLIYKNRFGKYSFAVPLLDQFILRQRSAEESPS